MPKWLDRRRARKQRAKEFAEINQQLLKDPEFIASMVQCVSILFDYYMDHATRGEPCLNTEKNQ